MITVIEQFNCGARDFRMSLTSLFFTDIDRNNAQAQPFQPGIGVACFFQDQGEGLAFGKGFDGVVEGGREEEHLAGGGLLPHRVEHPHGIRRKSVLLQHHGIEQMGLPTLALSRPFCPPTVRFLCRSPLSLPVMTHCIASFPSLFMPLGAAWNCLTSPSHGSPSLALHMLQGVSHCKDMCDLLHLSVTQAWHLVVWRSGSNPNATSQPLSELLVCLAIL